MASSGLQGPPALDFDKAPCFLHNRPPGIRLRLRRLATLEVLPEVMSPRMLGVLNSARICKRPGCEPASCWHKCSAPRRVSESRPDCPKLELWMKKVIPSCTTCQHPKANTTSAVFWARVQDSCCSCPQVCLCSCASSSWKVLAQVLER